MNIRANKKPIFVEIRNQKVIIIKKQKSSKLEK